MDQRPIPVFVFLDENIAQMDEEIENFFKDKFSDESEIFTLFFPFFPLKVKQKNQKGKKDYQVVKLVKQVIFSEQHVKKCLFQELKPILVFLTRDQNFIEDVVKEMREDGETIGGLIMPVENEILLIDDELSVPLSVVCVYHKPDIGKKAMLVAISETLKDFLNDNL